MKAKFETIELKVRNNDLEWVIYLLKNKKRIQFTYKGVPVFEVSCKTINAYEFRVVKRKGEKMSIPQKYRISIKTKEYLKERLYGKAQVE